MRQQPATDATISLLFVATPACGCFLSLPLALLPRSFAHICPSERHRYSAVSPRTESTPKLCGKMHKSLALG